MQTTLPSLSSWNVNMKTLQSPVACGRLASSTAEAAEREYLLLKTLNSAVVTAQIVLLGGAPTSQSLHIWTLPAPSHLSCREGHWGHVAALPSTQSTLWRLQTQVAGLVWEHSSSLSFGLTSIWECLRCFVRTSCVFPHHAVNSPTTVCIHSTFEK